MLYFLCIFAANFNDMLEKEFSYYLKHQDELVKKFNGRFIVIIGTQVVGDYDSFAEAVSESQKKYTLGTFLVQKCSEGTDDYTVSYHSRVRLPHAAI